MAYNRQGSLLPVAGLDTSKPAEYIDNQNSPNCNNVDVDHAVIRKRSGSSLLGTTISGTSTDILAGKQLSLNAADFAVRVGADKAQVWNGATNSWDAITDGGTTLATDADDEVSLCTPTLSGNRILVWTSGVYNPQKYTGTGNHADLGGTPPKAKYCENFGAYTLLAHITDDGGTAYRSRVVWSDTGLPETWGSGNSASKDLFDGNGDITGIKQFGNYITVHKQDMIYLGYLTTSGSVFRFDAKYTPGTICNNTIQMLPNGFMIYMAIDGIRIFNGTTSELVAGTINEELKEDVNLGKVHRSWSVLSQDEDEYWLGVPTGNNDYAQDVIRFNYNTGLVYKNNYSKNIRSAFTFNNTVALRWNTIGATETWDSCSLRWSSNTASTNFPIPLLSTDDGMTYRVDKSSTSDAGVAIDGTFESKDFTTGVEGQLGRWLQLEIWAKGSSMVVSYSTDKGVTWEDIGTLDLNSEYPTDESPAMLYFDTVSSRIRFRFRNNESSGNFYLKQYVFRYNPRELRGA